MDWNSWNVGRKTIFVSVCIAGLALCLRFIDNGQLSHTGFTKGVWKGYLIFMGIPLALVLTKGKINLYAGLFCGLGQTLGMMYFIGEDCAVKVGDETGNIAGTGAYLYGLMGAVMAYGVWMDHKSPNGVNRQLRRGEPRSLSIINYKDSEMSTRAFAGTLVGAVVIFLLLGGLSSWLAFFSVIGGAVFLLLAWKELTNARRVACSLVLLWFVLGWVAFSRAESNIAVAKSMTCPANRDYTIGQVLDTVCQRPRWKTLRPEDDGTHFVEFTGKTKKGKVLLQFCVDSDESTAELSYAEFDGTKMSMFEYAAFMNQAYNQYLQKKGR